MIFVANSYGMCYTECVLNIRSNAVVALIILITSQAVFGQRGKAYEKKTVI